MLSRQEKDEIMDRAIELYHEDEMTLDEISEILDQNPDYDGIIGQFDELNNENMDEVEDMNENDDMDENMDDMMDDDDQLQKIDSKNTKIK